MNSIAGLPSPSAPAWPSVTPPNSVPGLAPALSAALVPVGSPRRQKATGALEHALAHHAPGELLDHAKHFRDKVLPAMTALRTIDPACLERFAGIERLEAQDIADVIAFIVTRPRHVAINEVLIRPTDQEQ